MGGEIGAERESIMKHYLIVFGIYASGALAGLVSYIGVSGL